jgi:polyphenol oxidase
MAACNYIHQSGNQISLPPQKSQMQKRAFNDLQLWQFDNLSQQTGIKHFVSDRNANPYASEFTLSFSSSPDKELIRGHRASLAAALGVTSDRLVFPSQVHKTRIVQVTDVTVKDDLMETDALITSVKNICVAVMSADCVPILLYDKRNRAVGAVHSGWRGTVAKILERTLHSMKENFGTRGEDLVAGIGPSVCQDSYEVGEEVIEEVKQAFENAQSLMIPVSSTKARLDLWKANQIQLLEFGVPASAIEISDLCTVKNNDSFFSARKGDQGRFAAGIMIC